MSIDLNATYYKNKPYKTLDYWSRDMLNFDFLEKGLEIISPPRFVHRFLRKMFLMLYSINWPNYINFTIWLSLLFDILGNTCTAIVCFPGCGVMNFEINLIVLIKLVFYMSKKLAQRFKYTKWERKEILKWNKNHFSSISKSFHFPNIISDLRVRL